MARYNEILTGRLNRALAKLLSMKGDAVAPQLAGEIQPGVIFPLGAEFRYLEQWNTFSLAFQQLAVAANQSAIRLRNPPTSNVVAVFTLINIANISGGTQSVVVQQGAATTDLATVFTTTNPRVDARTSSNPTLIFSKQASAVSAPPVGTDNKLISQLAFPGMWAFIQYDAQEIPLLPGDALQLLSIQVNAELDAGIMWRERQLEESERF